MSERMPKKLIPLPRRTDPTPWLCEALARHTKGELIDALAKFARDDRAVLRRLAAHFELHAPLTELLAETRQAIADATAFDERNINRNFSYDDGAYSHVERNLQRLIQLGQLQPAMGLSLELIQQGSYQVEASDEGLMTDDIEACLRPILKAIRKCDLPAAEVVAWCTDMLRRDRVGFICEQELRELRQHFEASPPS
jgi:hypothetical protein